jgi:putative glutathione S-transferase
MIRQPNHFTKPFGIADGELKPERGRYRLIWSAACPWATRQMIARSLLGLEDTISVGLVDPIRPRPDAAETSAPSMIDIPLNLRRFRPDWAFTLDPEGRDPVLGVRLLSELYLNADPNYKGRFTVPAIIDIPSKKVVNNDYFNLTYYWEVEWCEFHKEGAPDLYPEELRDKIDALNEVIFHEVNNGVYKAGFAQSQEAYEAAYNLVFRRLDWLDGRLSESRYLFGDRVTDSDIRLYVTLIRFDYAYYNAFRMNRQRIRDFPNLWRYTKDLYHIPAFGENTLFDHIKQHYHVCCDLGNVYGITPKGPATDI